MATVMAAGREKAAGPGRPAAKIPAGGQYYRTNVGAALSEWDFHRGGRPTADSRQPCDKWCALEDSNLWPSDS
jgi:hypothetical protein